VSGADDKRFMVQKDGQDHGPFARSSLVDLANDGEIEPGHVVVDLKTKEARPAAKWAILERALADRAKKDADAHEQALREAGARRRKGVRWVLLALLVTVAIAALGALFVLGAEAGPHPDARIAGLVALYVLALAGLVAYVEREGSQASESAFHVERDDRWVLGFGLAALASAAPALVLAPYVSIEPTSFGEDLGHALVANEMARSGVGRGWVAGPLAGFPFGLHEAGLVPLVLRALVAMGLSPLGATHVLGTLGTVLTPIAAYVGGVRAHLRPLFALAGALVCAWVSASSPYAGGLGAFFGSGLVVSAVALPLCVLTAGELVSGTARWAAPLLAMLTVLVDPALLFATLLAVGVGSLVGMRAESPRAPALVATVRTTLASGLIATAVYGHGLSRLDIPFGPPAELAWRHEGFPLERLATWIAEGTLLDADRAPVLGYLVGAALLALVVQPMRPAARGVLAATLTTLVWPVLAGALFGRSESPLATSAVALLQPVHALALVPIAGGAALATALEESTPRLEQLVDTYARELDRVLGALALLALAAALGIAVPERLAFAARVRDIALQRAEAPCGPLTPGGYDRSAIAIRLRLLEQGRSFWSPDSLAAAQCAELDGLALESAVPVGATSGLGSHVGTMWLAFSRLEPSREGSSARAEALGVRHVLELPDVPLPEPWQRSETHGGFTIATHAPRTNLVGAGCAVASWSGSEDVLRAHVHEALATPEGADRLLSPTELVVLDASGGDFAEVALAHEGCDPSRTTITEIARESGALEADVDAGTPVELVFRVAAFPSWSVLVDGSTAREVRRVAPGFYAVHVGPGRHRVLARANGVPWLWPGIALALVLALLVAFASREWLERKVVITGERPDPWGRRRRS
jgi:hypothetical protein